MRTENIGAKRGSLNSYLPFFIMSCRARLTSFKTGGCGDIESRFRHDAEISQKVFFTSTPLAGVIVYRGLCLGGHFQERKSFAERIEMGLFRFNV